MKRFADRVAVVTGGASGGTSIPALCDERPYLVTHGPIPAAFEERIAACGRASRT